MKKHNIFKVVLITLLVMVLLTWLFPVGTISTTGYSEQGRAQIGLFDLVNNTLAALSYFGNIVIYILIVGGFYGILSKIPAYRVVLDKLVTKFKGKEKVVLSIIMVLLAVLTSVGGIQLGLVVFFPMLIALILLMGYDKVVAALTVVGSTMIGIAGTTFGYSNINVIMQALNISKITSEILAKIVILVLGLVLLIFNTLMYIKKQENKTTKKATKAASKIKKEVVAKVDEIEGFVPEKVSARKKVSSWPVITVLSVLFIIVVLSLVSWSGAFKITAFEKATEAVTKFELFKFPLFAKILGTFNPFGTWTINDLNIVIVLFTLLLAFIYKMETDEVIDAFVAGAKKALAPAFIVFLIYVCFTCTLSLYQPFQASFNIFMYNGLLSLTKEFNIFTGTLVAILASVFNVEPSYTFQSALVVLPTIIKSTSDYSIVAVVFQSVYGLTMLVAPTSVILMGTLTYLEIPYTKWLKTVWKLVLELLAVLLVVFIILALV